MFIFILTPCRLREKWQLMLKRSAAICSRFLATRCTRPKERGRYMSGKEPAWSRCFTAGAPRARLALRRRTWPQLWAWGKPQSGAPERSYLVAGATHHDVAWHATTHTRP